MRRTALAAVVSTYLVLGVIPARAASITYIETITASGSLGGNPFTDALVTLTAFADTNNITTVPDFPGVLSVDDNSATVDITGIGVATFTGRGTHFFVNQVGSRFVLPGVGLAAGTTAQPSPDILDIGNSAFTTYDLTTPFGPLTGAASGGGAGAFSFATSSGALLFDSFAVPPGTATFQAVLVSVPSPSSLVLATTAALIGLGYTWRPWLSATWATARAARP